MYARLYQRVCQCEYVSCICADVHVRCYEEWRHDVPRVKRRERSARYWERGLAERVFCFFILLFLLLLYFFYAWSKVPEKELVLRRLA